MKTAIDLARIGTMGAIAIGVLWVMTTTTAREPVIAAPAGLSGVLQGVAVIGWLGMIVGIGLIFLFWLGELRGE